MIWMVLGRLRCVWEMDYFREESVLMKSVMVVRLLWYDHWGGGWLGFMNNEGRLPGIGMPLRHDAPLLVTGRILIQASSA